MPIVVAPLSLVVGGVVGPPELGASPPSELLLVPTVVLPSVTALPHPDNETIPSTTTVARNSMSISWLTLPMPSARWQASRETV